MKNQGQGEGGRAPYDGTVATNFKKEKANSPLVAGKTLMEWKDKELSHTGDTEENYQRALELVRQGASEAMIHEEIPPGDQEVIKKYFKDIEKTVEKPNE